MAQFETVRRGLVLMAHSDKSRVLMVNRDKTLLIAHVVLACILGVFAGGLYYQVGVTIAGFQNRVGSLFFLGSLIAFSSLR